MLSLTFVELRIKVDRSCFWLFSAKFQINQSHYSFVAQPLQLNGCISTQHLGACESVLIAIIIIKKIVYLQRGRDFVSVALRHPLLPAVWVYLLETPSLPSLPLILD